MWKGIRNHFVFHDVRDDIRIDVFVCPIFVGGELRRDGNSCSPLREAVQPYRHGCRMSDANLARRFFVREVFQTVPVLLRRMIREDLHRSGPEDIKVSGTIIVMFPSQVFSRRTLF